MSMSAAVSRKLEKDARYALASHSRDLVYQTYGAAKMAGSWAPSIMSSLTG